MSTQHRTAIHKAATRTAAAVFAPSRLAVMVICVFGCVLPARALDLNGPSGVETRTLAFREWLRKQSDHKKYGAETIQDRDRRPWRPDGIRAGNLVFLPEIGVGALYDDNVFATNDERKADVRSELTPSLRVQSSLPRHALDIAAGAKIVNHARFSELDFVDGFGRFTGALHFDHAHTLAVTLSSEFEHKDRADIFGPTAAAEPIAIWHNRARVALTRDAGRLYGSLSGGATDANYYDVRAFDGTLIDQDVRDYSTYFGQLNWGYRFSPGFELVGKAKLVRRLTDGNDQVDWDAYAYQALMGVAFEFNPLVRFTLLGGYGIRDYDAAQFATTDTALFEAGVQWLATQQMTVSATLSRNFGDPSSPLGEGRVETALRADIMYEVWRNLLVTGGASAIETRFDTVARNDMAYSGTAGIEYLHTKNWAFNMSFEHQYRQSEKEDFGLRRNRIRVGAKLRF